MGLRVHLRYAAVCDGCAAVATYITGDGAVAVVETRAAAVTGADGDWAMIDGRVLCERCRPCERCAVVGNVYHGTNTIERPGMRLFLCIDCQQRPCRSCGHVYWQHMVECGEKGALVSLCYAAPGGCGCRLFTEPVQR